LLEYGHIDIDITAENLSSLVFKEEVICYKQIPILETYYNEHNSKILEISEEYVPNWMFGIADKIPKSWDYTYHSILKVPPGQTIPYHKDKHYKIQKKYGKGDTFRYWITLEDWKSGHYFDVDDQPFFNWKKGDYIKFSDEWHTGGNMGREPKYVAQITCLTL
tara:strand:- start:1155 stop:1643 length:489 start_codon:yes stop_codon:yes gene_type:complete